MISAVWWKRLLACLLDVFLFALFVWLADVVRGMLMPFAAEAVRYLIRYVPLMTWGRVSAVLVIGTPVVCFLLYFLVPVLRYGRTLGGRMTGLRVVAYVPDAEESGTDGEDAQKQNNAPAWQGDSMPLRTGLMHLSVWLLAAVFMFCIGMSWGVPEHGDVLLSLPGILLLVFALLFLSNTLCILAEKKRRSLHEMWAGTMVVSTSGR